MSPFLQWTIGATIKTTFSKIVKDRETQDKKDKWKTARSQNCIYTNKILFDYFFLWVVLPSPGIHLLLFRWPPILPGSQLNSTSSTKPSLTSCLSGAPALYVYGSVFFPYHRTCYTTLQSLCLHWTTVFKWAHSDYGYLIYQ